MFTNIPSQESPFPVDFRLLNQQGQATLYTRLPTQRVALELINAARGDMTIALPAAPEPSDPTAKQQWCIDNHCFYISFRSGTLWAPDELQLAGAAAGDWQLVRNAGRKDLDGYFLVPRTAQEIKAGQRITLQLQGVQVDGRGGSRSTQVECHYKNLTLAGSDAPLAGSRLHYLAIMDELPSQDPGRAPVRINWVGSNTLLNDGKTLNTLNLRLRNDALDHETKQDQSLALTQASSITLQFTYADNDPWALMHKDDLDTLTCKSPNWEVTNKSAPLMDAGRFVVVLNPSGGQTEIDAGQWIDISITLRSSVPDGTDWVTVSYSGFGHLSDTVWLPVIKTPILTSLGKVGIGLATLTERLNVSGNLHIEDGTVNLHGDGNGFNHQSHDHGNALATYIDKDKAGISVTGPMMELSVNGVPVAMFKWEEAEGREQSLEVPGNIKLGTEAQYYATAAEEPLRIIHGRVYQGGGGEGEGFKATMTAPGSFVVTYDQPFKSGSRPTVIPALVQGRSVQVAKSWPSKDLDIILNQLESDRKDNEGFSIDIMYRDTDGYYKHYGYRGFDFIAIGPR
jgi:hypothetical protein